MILPHEFVEMLSDAVGEENAAVAIAALDGHPSVSVRLNPAKRAVLPILEGSVPVKWNPLGAILQSRPVFTLHPLFHAGAYYVQDSSSMIVGEVFRRLASAIVPEPGSPVRILDLCAAPGGKSTDIASSARAIWGDAFLLVANEPVGQRATVLADNVARWGDSAVAVSSSDPSRFGALGAYFDIIVTDVPCSGEGMFRKDSGALEQWSPENVNLCVARSRRIVSDVWPSLREGGILIYSTCTYNKYENDGNVRWICDNLGAEVLPTGVFPSEILHTRYGVSLLPGLVPGEGQYCAALRKTVSSPKAVLREGKSAKRDSGDKLISSMLPKIFASPYIIRKKGDMFIGIPSILARDIDYVDGNVGLIRSGCALGQVKGNDFVPDEDLALCSDFVCDAFPVVDVDKETALAFLHKDSFTLEGAPLGIVVLRYKGIPLGFVKNLGRRVNNLHPSSRRIRMDISGK